MTASEILERLRDERNEIAARAARDRAASGEGVRPGGHVFEDGYVAALGDFLWEMANATCVRVLEDDRECAVETGDGKKRVAAYIALALDAEDMERLKADEEG